MIKILTILAFTIFSLASQAQNGLPFEAKAGYIATKDSLEDMELMMVVVTSGKDSPTYLNLETGESDSWMYCYRDKNDTTYNALYFVLKDNSGWMLFPLVENLELPEGSKPLDNVNWLGSNGFFEALSENSIFKKYMTDNPNPGDIQILLTFYPFDFDENVPKKYINQYLWLFQTEGLQCVTNALTGETDCMLTTDVDTENLKIDNVKFFPNPAYDELNIQNDNEQDYYFEIYNTYGKKVKRMNLLGSNLSKMTVNDLPVGVYIVKIFDKDKYITKKLTIMK
jgi:hypothetical protein